MAPDDPRPVARHGATADPGATAPLRILFVEDNLNDVEFIVRALRQGGFQPVYRVVQDRDEMQAALGQERWDVIVSDHSMPSFDAPAALEVMKASGQDLPFIVVSGHIGEETAVACMRAGAHDWVSKDHPARLVPAIARELREAEQRRQRVRAEERYRLLVEHAADLIVVVDAEARVSFQSPSVTRVLGYAENELIGRPVLELVHPEDAERVTQIMNDALREGRRVTLDRVRVRHRDGSWRTLEGSGARMIDDRGQPWLVAAARDITERVLLQQQLVQSQKMEAVGRLAGGVAHDFNNLLTVILGYGDLLLEQLADNHLLHQEVDEIKRAAARAAVLTQQLLAFSRKQVLSPRVIDLNAELNTMSGMLRRILGEDVGLELRLQQGVGHVRVDPGQLEQVLLNLVINARDAMSGSGRVTVGARDVQLDERQGPVRGVTPGRYVEVTVRDTGHGMDEDTLAQLFEPFFTTKEPGRGTGLGLSTAYGIIRQSGGSIFAESAPGEGSLFHILLPRVEEEVAKNAETPPDTARSMGHETMLLVEDEPLVRGLVHDIMRKSGYRVLETGRGEEAVEIARHHAGPIHLLLTDVVMPGMSGLETAARVAEIRAGVRVLYMSGYSDELVMRHGLPPGHGFIQKPFTPDMLLRKVRELLDVGVESRGTTVEHGARS